jgi:diacylglycerol kinase (ATP)
MSTMNDKIMLIVNPAGGGGKSIDLLPEVEKRLISLKAKLDIRITENPQQATELASRASQCGYKRIAAMGGDGTVNMVAAGLFGSDSAMAVIPTGSGNDFFKMLNIENNLDDICRAVVSGDESLFDVGLFNGKPFFNMLGIGFDARVAMEANKKGKNLGLLSYLLAVYGVLKQYQAYDVKLRIDSYELAQEILLVAIGIGRSTGSGFYLTPQASANDGKFDVCVARNTSRRRIITILPKALKGGHVREPEVTMYRCKQLEIYSQQPLPIHYEGETLTTANGKLSIKISRRKLKVISGVKKPK